MPTINLTLPPLHEAQQIVFDSPARYRVLVAGRRFGKSRLAATEVIRAMLARGNVWWVSPTYDISKRVGWRMVEHLLRPLVEAGYATANRADLMIELPNGGRFQAKSSDQPEKLVGEGLDLVIIDESGIVQESAWRESLRPALSDRSGRALLIGTPKGKNWFWHEYNRGQDDLREDYESWKIASSANPYMPDGEVEAAESELPSQIFKQEYLAEFLDDAGAVFRGVTDCIIHDPLPDPITDPVVIGVDWARSQDFTVLIALGTTTKRVYEIDRFHQINWTLQRGRLKAMADKYKPRLILAESNSIGEPNIEELAKQGLPIQGFQTTLASKPGLIDGLALAIENREIGLLDDPVLIHELQAYEMERLPSGNWRYNAPSGGHDDTVIALALSWRARTEIPLAIENRRRARGLRSAADDWWSDD